jgi:hypothetical protein
MGKRESPQLVGFEPRWARRLECGAWSIHTTQGDITWPLRPAYMTRVTRTGQDTLRTQA